ncbi:RICIN domain-containing protein [Streptomyces sp. NPDC056661]|uniref:RICIN domain-containing protein n=1 Tax=Streptomyces sp. NPDC056661 TaxID=3345898 RepID=UPI00369B5EA6
MTFTPRNVNEKLNATQVSGFNFAKVQTTGAAGFSGLWDLKTPDTGSLGFVIQNRANRYCLDTSNGGSSTALAARPCDGTPSQSWNLDFIAGGGNLRVVRNSFTGDVLTKQPGNPVPFLRDLGIGDATNQQWQTISVKL